MALRASGRHLFALPAAVILDEAHALGDTAREMLGHRATLGALRGAIEGARHQLHPEDRAWQGVLQRHAAFEALLAPRVTWGASEEADRFDLARDEALIKSVDGLSLGLRNLADRLGGMRDTPPRQTAIQRLEDAIGALRGLQAPEAHIAWVEGSRGKKQVSAIANAPRNLAGILRTRLFDRGVPVVLTSATLSVAEDFTYMKEELGLESPLACSVGSPFDYERQARLYVAEDLPDPGADPEAFYRAALERLKEILTTVGGRTLVLFTAKTRSKQAYQALKAWGQLPVMLQDRANPHMVEQFQALREGALLGTAYWEGLDVPGLSAVVIVKLPFPAEDPLLAAKQEAARDRGEDPFDAVLLPEMLLKLKQGSGRLIRRSTDRGVIAILDPRAATRERYRDLVEENLPPAPRIRSLEEIKAFLHGDTALKP
jgi:ATP-dependent DNA helicase DinG